MHGYFVHEFKKLRYLDVPVSFVQKNAKPLYDSNCWIPTPGGVDDKPEIKVRLSRDYMIGFLHPVQCGISNHTG